jgi:hypothetical protein
MDARSLDAGCVTRPSEMSADRQGCEHTHACCSGTTWGYKQRQEIMMLDDDNMMAETAAVVLDDGNETFELTQDIRCSCGTHSHCMGKLPYDYLFLTVKFPTGLFVHYTQQFSWNN